MTARTHYEVLGISPSSTQEAVKAAYRGLARKLHPDRSPDTAAQFRDVAGAYAVLGDPKRRAEYDASLLSPAGAAAPFVGKEVWQAVEQIVGPIDQEAAGQVLETLFGDMLDKAKSRLAAKIQEAIVQSTSRRR